MANVQLSESTALVWAEVLTKNHNLRTLNLEGNLIASAGVSALAAALCGSGLVELKLDHQVCGRAAISLCTLPCPLHAAISFARCHLPLHAAFSLAPQGSARPCKHMQIPSTHKCVLHASHSSQPYSPLHLPSIQVGGICSAQAELELAQAVDRHTSLQKLSYSMRNTQSRDVVERALMRNRDKARLQRLSTKQMLDVASADPDLNA